MVDRSDCVNVEHRFPQYKLGYEDPAFQGTQNPWHKVIVCRAGHICPAGGEWLWACTNGPRSQAAKSLRQLVQDGSATLMMDGDDGINVRFPVADWERFFKLMGAKRR